MRTVCFTIQARPPFRLDLTAWALRRRPHNQIDAWDGTLAASDQRLGMLVRRFIGVRSPRFASVFEALVNAVACQQLSLTVGIHLLDRLAEVYGPEVAGATPGFPTAERLAAAEVSQLRRLGFSLAKARTFIELSRGVASGALDLDELAQADDEHAAAALVALPGIGRWSAEYVLLRGLGRLEVLPGDDVGAHNNLRCRFEQAASASYSEVAPLAMGWWPYGGVVYCHLLVDEPAQGAHLDDAAPGTAAHGSAPLHTAATRSSGRPTAAAATLGAEDVA